MSDRALSLMGLARRAGKLAIGEESCGISVRTGKARVLFLASDASDNASRRAKGYAGDRIPLVRLPNTKEELSLALGKTGCSMTAVLDLGLACEIVSALAESVGGLEEMLAELETRRDKAKRRRKP